MAFRTQWTVKTKMAILVVLNFAYVVLNFLIDKIKLYFTKLSINFMSKTFFDTMNTQ
jgi:hypothetical protein